MNRHEDHDLDRVTCSAALTAFIAEARDLRMAAMADPESRQRRLMLREWQVARLARTHADLLGSERYGQAATFFLTDLYSAKDCGERDAELERILPLMTSMLPVSGLRTLLLAIELMSWGTLLTSTRSTSAATINTAVSFSSIPAAMRE